MHVLWKSLGIWSVVILLAGLTSNSWANTCYEPYDEESFPVFSGNVPETFEELLRLFKEFMQDTNADGYVFVERISGTPRQAWQFLMEREDRVRVFQVAFSPHYSRPYLPCLFRVFFNEQGRITQLGSIPLRSPEQRALPEKMTPRRVRHILGEPTTIAVLPGSDMGRPQYTIKYLYRIKNYYLSIYFYSKELVGDFRAKNLEEKKRFIEYLRDYQVHKDIQANSMVFGD